MGVCQGDKSTWSEYDNFIELIYHKAVGELGYLPKFEAISMKIFLNKKNSSGEQAICQIRIEMNDQVRMDAITTHYKELTPEIYERISQLLQNKFDDILSIFKPKAIES